MQVKTIEKVITKKMNEWLETIQAKDAQLAKDVRDNLLVSGGCIANLLLGEPVNDYDVYLQDKGVLERLCRFYTGETDIELLFGDLLEEYLQEYPKAEGLGLQDFEYPSARYIAIRNLKPGQIKLFSAIHKSAGYPFKYSDEELKQLKYVPAFISPNAISLTDDIQIVVRFYGSPEQVHKTFDFIHATNYFTWKDGLVCNVDALLSLMTRQLRYQGSMYPVTSIIRIKKFLGRKFKISAGEILKILLQVSELDLRNPRVLEEQLIGVDVAYFSTLIKVLEGVKQETITSEYLATLIDRIFNGEIED